MTEGLRERKKRRTRQHISEVAIGLFVERGFDRVTIAEVAAAADVSVNTVYNYFEAKEDLVLPPDQASAERLADIVRDRRSGESAAGAVLAHLRGELRTRDRKIGLTEGYGRFYEMMRAAPTLTARLEDLGRRMTEALSTALADEEGLREGKTPDDQLPRVVASQIGWFHSLVYSEVGRRLEAGEEPDVIAEGVLELLDVVEESLGERTLTYCTRGGRKCSE